MIITINMSHVPQLVVDPTDSASLIWSDSDFTSGSIVLTGTTVALAVTGSSLDASIQTTAGLTANRVIVGTGTDGSLYPTAGLVAGTTSIFLQDTHTLATAQSTMVQIGDLWRLQVGPTGTLDVYSRDTIGSTWLFSASLSNEGC